MNFLLPVCGAWLLSVVDCPVWPCEAIIVVVSVAVGGVIGYYVGRSKKS